MFSKNVTVVFFPKVDVEWRTCSLEIKYLWIISRSEFQASQTGTGTSREIIQRYISTEAAVCQVLGRDILCWPEQGRGSGWAFSWTLSSLDFVPNGHQLLLPFEWSLRKWEIVVNKTHSTHTHTHTHCICMVVLWPNLEPLPNAKQWAHSCDIQGCIY